MLSEKIVSSWYDKLGEKCLKFYEKSQDNEITFLKKLLNKIPSKSLILDAGCGIGLPSSKYLSNEGHKIIGIDISRNMIKLARKNVPKAFFKEESLYNLKIENEKFDAIISFFVILHLKKTKVLELFNKFNKILKDKGYLLFSTNMGRGSGFFTFFGKKVFLSFYTKKEIKEILEESNFKIIQQKDFLFKKNKNVEKHMYWLVQKK